MTLAIDRFVTRCRVSPRAALERGRIDHVVRTEFVEQCALELASAFRGHTGVVRIRRLAVKLALSRVQLGDTALARQWAATFATSLKCALALPDRQGAIELRRFESRADWLGAAIEAVLHGDLSDRWEFAEFLWISALPFADAVRRILSIDTGSTAEVLVRLAHRGSLDTLLLNLDEIGLEQLLHQLENESVAGPMATLDDVLTIAGFVQRATMFRTEKIVSRRRAIALWAALADSDTRRWTPRRVSDALRALDILTGLFVGSSHEDIATRLLRRMNDDSVDENIVAVLAAVLSTIASASVGGDAAARDAIARLTATLHEIAQSIPFSAEPSTGRRVASGFAGLLLLIPSVVRLDWIRAIRTTSPWKEYGPRVGTYVLAAVGAELLARFDPDEPMDSSAAIFAGWMDEPDFGGYRRFIDGVDTSVCTELAHALDLSVAAVSDWPTLVSSAAERLVREFASRIRGFDKSSRAFVVEKLLAVPGEIAIESRTLSVSLAACPYHVALHVCSAFEPVGAVDWLGFRDIVFKPGAV